MRIPALLGAMLIAAACTSDLPPVARDYTAYVGTLPPASGGGERTARVTLRDGGAAAVQMSSPGPGGDFFAEGTWQQKDEHIIIELTSAPPARLVFLLSGDLMFGREWDRALWGDKEPVLHLVR